MPGLDLMHSHSPIFVVLALIVAILGSWTALDLFRRVQTHLGRSRAVWLATSAVAMGLSIWSMHFVAMLGFDPGAPVAYDPALTLLSLVLAIAATAAAFVLAARRAGWASLLAAGAVMGGGICLMHYVGMAAVRTPMALRYNAALVAASLAIAVIASTCALLAARRVHSLPWRAAAAVVLGGAVVSMHYTGMAALEMGDMSAAAGASSGAPPLMLAVLVSGGTLLILILTLVAALYDQGGRILSALDAGGVGYWELDLRTRTYRFSHQTRLIYGVEGDQDPTAAELIELIHPDDVEPRERLLQAALQSGTDYDVEYRMREVDRWVNVRGRVSEWDRHRPVRMTGIVLDVSDRHAAFAAVSESERRQRLLIDELNHRVKNTLATVQSIASQTGKNAESMEAFLRSFTGRLVALSSTHDALTHGGWELARLRDLLEREFSPYSAEQVLLEGDDLEVGPRHALALGMVLHEMATNAAKYGALSNTAGQVRVSWAVQALGGDKTLTLSWSEHGGPEVTPPTRAGFGSRLIRMSVEHDLKGEAAISYAAEGFGCVLTLPLASPRPIDETLGRFSF